ncbi:MAG: Ig-like domain-containing protein, partial [Treponema sp.]|nr:Ig-like domain-containing protein [Treponema sp.]
MKKKRGVFFGMTIVILAAVFTLAGCWLLNKGQDDVNLLLPPANPVVTSVTISPNSTDIAKGGNKTFTASVAGINSPAQTVTWSVSGNAAAGTAISSAGVLTVDLSEAGGIPLTITATSMADASKSAVATVTVEYAIGDAGPAGGIIFYVDSADTYPLWKYLEAAP